MDTGEGRFKGFTASGEKEFKERMSELQKLYPGHGGIFKVGEEVELKGSRFKISKILQGGLKLKLLPKVSEDMSDTLL